MRLAGKGEDIDHIERLLLKKGYHSQRNGHNKSAYPVKVHCKVYMVAKMPVRVAIDRRRDIGTVTINDTELMAICNKVGGRLVDVLAKLKKVPKHGYRRN
jgi:hypothetical protein